MNLRSTLFLAICFAASASASAAVSRTAVSVTGSDLNPCTPASPCRSFSAALAQTLPGGEVVALDSGGYGPFVVNQAVTVQTAAGVYAGITVPESGIGITINASSEAVVVLRGLTIIGLGAQTGIQSFLVQPILHIENCSIFSILTGVIDSGTSGALFIDHSVIRDCTFGVRITAIGPSTRTAVLTDSRMEWISDESLFVDSYGDVTVRNCVITGNFDGGAVFARTGFGAGASQSVKVVLENSMIAFGNYGVISHGSGSAVTLSRCALTRNLTPCWNDGGALGLGTIRSLGNNNMQDNAVPCAPTVTVPLH